MIILNRRKDYYDYLAGVYGVDTKKVLDRVNDITSSDLCFIEPLMGRGHWFSERHNTYAIYIANRKYIVEQVAEGVWKFQIFHKVDTNFRGDRLHRLENTIEKKTDWQYYIQSDFNKNCGRVLSIEMLYGKEECLLNKSPILSTFGFSSILPPTEVYSEIDMMLGWHIDNPCKIPELDNKGKVLANGFDDKTSFRHRK